jgi:hypothetical protein
VGGGAGNALDDAGKPSTRDNQTKPQNQWTTHPVIDGCEPRDDGRENGRNNGLPAIH